MVENFGEKLANYDNLSKDEQDEVYREAMYGGFTEPEEPKDTSDSKSIDSCFDD